MPGAYDKATEFLSKHLQTQQHSAKVSALVEGFETSFGMELLATVHWVATKEHAKTSEQIIQQAYQWNTRKQQFTPRQIELAYKVLCEKDWINN